MKKRLQSILVLLVSIIILITFLTGCALEDDDAEKEELYSQALQDLNVNQTTDLDNRYNKLNDKVSHIREKKEEFDMAQFTRIKIELDFLTMENYSSAKVASLTKDFMLAFAEAETAAEEAVEKTYQGSLSDRFSDIDRDIEKISAGKTELSVVQFLKIEKGLKRLEEDEYPVPEKVNQLKAQLHQLVLTELETAIFTPEVPEEDFIEEEEKEPTMKETIIYGKLPTEKKRDPRIYVVELINGGFGMSKIRVNVNDTVKWRNARTGRYVISLVVGNRDCREINSGIYKAGESYEYTFTEPMTCLISDGIFTTQTMNVIVS